MELSFSLTLTNQLGLIGKLVVSHHLPIVSFVVWPVASLKSGMQFARSPDSGRQDIGQLRSLYAHPQKDELYSVAFGKACRVLVWWREDFLCCFVFQCYVMVPLSTPYFVSDCFLWKQYLASGVCCVFLHTCLDDKCYPALLLWYLINI